ncbi:hypothetical protein Tco_0016956 [Tanacetum coccineum]
MNYDLRICKFAVYPLRIIPLVDMWRIPINGLLWHIVIGSEEWCLHIGVYLKTIEWLPMCEESEKDVGGRIWLDMMIVYCRRIAFVQELRSMAGETVPAKTALFLEKMMDKEGNREWQLCDLENEAREMAFEIEAFLLKLMDEEPSHRRAAAEDRRFATQLNTLREEMENVCEKRRNLAYELRSVKGIIDVGKASEFVTDTLRKDDAEMAQLRELERQMELRALEKELFIQKLVHNDDECMCLPLEAYRIQAMTALPICDELRQTVNSSDWEVMFTLRYRREIAEDLRLAREINALCARLTAGIDERDNFKDELDVLAGRRVPEKMLEFVGVVQGKDILNLMKLQILEREFELRAQEKDIFIEKLKGNMEF